LDRDDDAVQLRPDTDAALADDISEATSGPPLMTTLVRIEHSSETPMSRSVGFDVLKVALMIGLSVPLPITSVLEPAATALFAGVPHQQANGDRDR
jgi:hypothetical protein